MPRLRSQTRRPALRVLPREVLARCIEFLPFDHALVIKQVSKELRSAARRAIAHGRWRPIKFVAERALDLVSAMPVPAAALSTFRAAWELDAGLVVREIAEWNGPGGGMPSQFLQLVEPTIDGLPRIVAACERTQRFIDSLTGTSIDDEDQRHLRDSHIRWQPVHMLVKWSERVGRPLMLDFDKDDDEGHEDRLYIATWFNERSEYDAEHYGSALFGSGLEAWNDPKLAVRFVFNLMEKELDPYMGEGGSFVDMSDHRRWARDWEDRAKADAFEEAARALHIYADTSFDY